MKPLDADQLARLGGGVLDIPPRVRNLLLVAGFAGLVLVVVESLVGRSEATLPVDKVLHFSGYFTLAAVFVLGLRPRLYVPALVALVGMGIGIEYLQPLNSRTFDWSDASANALGVAVGGAVGLLVRTCYAYIRKELAVADARRRQVHFRAGDLILRQGQPTQQFFVISRGEVTLTRETDGTATELGNAGPGQAIGVLGVVRGEPQYCSVRAKSKVSLVRMSVDDLFESAGGRAAPVAAVLSSMADAIGLLGDRLANCQCGAADPHRVHTHSSSGVS